MRRALIYLSCAGLAACATTTTNQSGTLSELESVPADVEDIHVADGLERAAESYRRYLEETPKSAKTPEAMRRLADLQIEQAYGVMGSGDMVQMAAPDAAQRTEQITARQPTKSKVELSESDEEFIARATGREQFLAPTITEDPLLPGASEVPVPTETSRKRSGASRPSRRRIARAGRPGLEFVHGRPFEAEQLAELRGATAGQHHPFRARRLDLTRQLPDGGARDQAQIEFPVAPADGEFGQGGSDIGAELRSHLGADPLRRGIRFRNQWVRLPSVVR